MIGVLYLDDSCSLEFDSNSIYLDDSCDRLKTCRDGYVLMEQENDSVATVLRQSGGGDFSVKLPPAACTIPGYEINLRQCTTVNTTIWKQA
jgi:hypothetical protein